VQRPELFEEVATLRGVDPRGWRIVYRYRPGSVAGAAGRVGRRESEPRCAQAGEAPAP
jgi:hypothetical protein